MKRKKGANSTVLYASTALVATAKLEEERIFDDEIQFLLTTRIELITKTCIADKWFLTKIALLHPIIVADVLQIVRLGRSADKSKRALVRGRLYFSASILFRTVIDTKIVQI